MSTSSDLIAAVERLVKDHMAQFDPSHDWAHVDRVRNTALAIAKTLPEADILVVELAALLHDLTDAKYTQGASLEELTGSVFDKTADVSPQQLRLVFKIVPSVSYSTEKKLKAANEWTPWHQTCLELHAVQDADRLDAIGAIGVLRCAAFSGARGRYLVEDKAEAGPGCEGHFYDKLLKVKGWMKMKVAAKLNSGTRRFVERYMWQGSA
ncbi:uncharacterized protein EHS24_004410 [Apiotrichum porosum]|uniref:HD/PDEase domain-containing protein n=1 Tax=Apiotrichum porosum TaxID=105984 RepID=A0A427Y515_9TREE|nr:uncharacterized protein EHS24_004410 [Apiotrichum porosum]RSH86179.1 hypothetical protein EHS24_004410 [Apiotrichum porosum]